MSLDGLIKEDRLKTLVTFQRINTRKWFSHASYQLTMLLIPKAYPLNNAWKCKHVHRLLRIAVSDAILSGWQKLRVRQTQTRNAGEDKMAALESDTTISLKFQF